LIHNLKYRGYEEIGSAIADWCADDMRSVDILSDIDEIIPVPLHKKKLKERGYNQVTTFGKSLSHHLKRPFNEHLLIRTKYSKTQTRKNLLNRIEVNNRDIFDVVYELKEKNKHYLLIDDVLTTGSTLEACGKALLKIPGAKISIFCIAMSH
jgi:ComF family protein